MTGSSLSRLNICLRFERFFPRVNLSNSSSVKESVRSITSPAHPGLWGVRICVGTIGKQLSVQCGRKGPFLPSGGNGFPRLLEPLQLRARVL